MKLLIIRHGESENNRLHALTGSYEGRSPDPRLTSTGEEQAGQLAQAMLSGLQPAPQVLYSSLMWRAVQTSAVIADALDLPVLGHLEAYECGGPYVGTPQQPIPAPGASASELVGITPRLQLPVGVDETGWYRGDGEDDRERAQRGARVIEGLKRLYLGQEILIGLVCHEWISQHLVRAALGFHARDGVAEPWLSLRNTATTLIDFEQPVPVTEIDHQGGELERVLHWHNNYVHLSPGLLTG